MPSTLVHAALAALIGTALLGRAFSGRSLAVVVAAVILIDFDVFVGYAVVGAHRAAFHNLLVPAIGAAGLYYDVEVREESWLRDRWGRSGPRTAAVAVVAVVFAGLGPDFVTNGINLLYPVHDQFYAVDGHLKYSTRDGIIQSFVEERTVEGKGSTETIQYETGADPTPAETGVGTGGGGEPKRPPERTFLIVSSGMQLLLVAIGTVVPVGRLREER